MRRILPLALCALLVGCEYKTPLVLAPEIPIHKSVIGLWQKEGGGTNAEKLLILPLGEREYMVSYPAGSTNSMFAQACLWKGSGLTLVQLKWFGYASGAPIEGGSQYQFAAYSHRGGLLDISLLNSETVDKGAESPEDLAAAIEENKNSDSLFKKAMYFVRVSSEE